MEESFGFPELAQDLERTLTEGRNFVKPKALHDIEKLQTEMSNAVTRFGTEETVKQQSQTNQFQLNRLRRSNEFTQPFIDGI
jgi:hypothetical protein